jgi:phytoene synthase
MASSDVRPVAPQLRSAYRGCSRVQLQHDPTYWWATQRLPRSVRPAIHALYAYVRMADELVDGPLRPREPARRREALDAWQAELEGALDGRPTTSPTVAALVDAGARHDLPLHELGVYMDSMRVDCGPVRIADRGELDRYMRGSAGAVGIIMARLIDGTPHEMAQMATAFQLTNFIRDVAEDWALDRIYLPGLQSADLSAAVRDEASAGGREARARVRDCVAAEAQRARGLFAATAHVPGELHPRLRSGVRVARTLYEAVLDRLERLDFDVLGGHRPLTAGGVTRALGRQLRLPPPRLGPPTLAKRTHRVGPGRHPFRPKERLMADLTPLDEKLAEVLGLAQAAQTATDTVSKMEDAESYEDALAEMKAQAAETERRTDALIDGLEGKKTAIRDMARETKGEATEMMKTYLEGEEEALDGFEFLSMAEAGELSHWEIVEQMAKTIAAADVLELATWAVGVQREHVATVRRVSLELATEEIREAATA